MPTQSGSIPPVQVVVEHLTPIQPPKFNGNRSSALKWLNEYDEIMDANGFTDEKKLIKARAYMTDAAKSWFKMRKSMNPQWNWYSFKELFMLDFCGSDAIEQLRKKLDNMNQKSGEHPTEFALRLLEIAEQVDVDMTSREKASRVFRGLRIDIRNALCFHNPMKTWDLDNLLRLLASYEVEPKAETSQRSNNSTTTQSKNKSESTSDKRPPRNLATWKCMNCGELGHDTPDCKLPKNDTKIEQNLAAHRASKAAAREQQSTSANSVHISHIDKPTIVSRLPCDDQPKPTQKLDLNGLLVEGRIDSGADMTVISSDVAEALKLNLLPWKAAPLSSANKTPLRVLGMATVLATFENVSKPLLVVVIPAKSLNQILWGNDVLRPFKMQLDFSKDTLEVATSLQVARTANSVTMRDVPEPVNQVKLGDMEECYKHKIIDTLISFEDVFSRSEEDIGRTSLIKHRINLTSEVPVNKRRYQVPLKNLGKMEEIINRMKASGTIRDSTSPYASPGFLVAKDDGKDKRLVADYRMLNAITVPDATPMPHPEDVLTMLAGSKVFAKLDITAMFNQIAVDERDIAKTAMTTQFGLFEYVTMPFGLKNAPATAVRLMREVLRGLDEKTCYVYFDDIIVFANDLEQLNERVTEVLKRIRSHKLKLKPRKCTIGATEVSFLGHIISARGIDVDPKRFIHVKQFRIPQNPSDVRSFHGLCSYNRKFIKDFAKIAKPLTLLMGKPSDFLWTVEAQKAFETLRDKLTSAPTLVHFNPEAEHELRTDASSYALGAVLYQKHEDPNQTGVVLYHSKTLNRAQRNYSATEREMLAALDSITSLNHYLRGKRFTLVTDHAALSMLRNHKDPHQRLARWIAKLMEYDFEVRYKSGSTHKDADCMSRLVRPNLDENDEDADVDNLINASDFSQAEDLMRAICSVSSQQDFNSATQPHEDALNKNVNLADMENEQREDQFCKRYIETLESTSLTDDQKAEKAYRFTLQDRKLYRDQSNGLVLVVPARRRAAVILSCHDCPLGGHFAFEKTLSVIKSRFYWPKMRRDIKQHIRTCKGCQMRKAPTKRRQGLTMPLPIAEEVFDIMGIDLITKLPRSHDGYNTLLVCTDNLSKYAIVVPLKNELGVSVRYALFNQVIAKYGCPKIVISDRGANLISETQKDFFDLFGIKRQLTSAFRPQSNGQTERFNRTLGESLTIYVERNQKDWPDFIQAITFAYNNANHSVTRVSPYELVFGRRPRIPIDNILDRENFVDPENPVAGHRSSEAIKLMKKLISDNQQANKRRRDKRLTECTFKEGDLVVVERPTRIKGGTHKLTYTYVGPFKILRKLGDLSFELGEGTHNLRSYVVHPYHLRKFHQREGDVADELVDPSFVARPPDVEEPEHDTETDTADEGDIDFTDLPFPPVLSPHAQSDDQDRDIPALSEPRGDPLQTSAHDATSERINEPLPAITLD